MVFASPDFPRVEFFFRLWDLDTDHAWAQLATLELPSM